MLTGDILRLSARRHPNKTAIATADDHLTYSEFDAAANRLANALLACGVAKGDFVLAMSPNVIEYPVIHYGTARSGAVLVHVSPLAGSAELEHVLETVKPKVLFVHQNVETKLRQSLRGPGNEATVVVVGTAQSSSGVPFNDFIQQMDDAPPMVALQCQDPFAMTFTGGTTGLPKGALVDHESRFISAWSTALEHGIKRDDVVAVVTPLYHVVSMLIWMQAGILVGATCVIQRKWDVAEFEQLASCFGITSVFMVPLQLRGLLSSDGIATGACKTLRQIGCGGASLSAELKAECLDKLPEVTLHDHYGQSETGLLTILNANKHRDKLGTVGQAAVGVELAVVDPDGQPLAPGEVGAIVARGAFLFSGYHQNEAEDRLYFRGGDGWGWTGDLGMLDPDGFLTIVGRSKEMVVSGGVNIYPREVERVLEERPDIVDCAVFGVPDDKWGETLVACVVSDRTGLRSEDVISHCEARIARVKRPKYVWFVDEIPKTPSGKTQKNRLRDTFMKTEQFRPQAE